MAFVPGPNNYVGVLADFLASGFNVFPTAWIVGQISHGTTTDK
jgi:aromatic-L-amino-acid decarboxylase